MRSRAWSSFDLSGGENHRAARPAARAAPEERRRHGAALLRDRREPLSPGRRRRAEPAARDRAGRDLGRRAPLIDALAREAFRRRPCRRHARADAARRRAARRGGERQDAGALAGFGAAAGADRPADRAPVRRRGRALRRSRLIIAPRHAGAQHHRRDRRGADARAARRRSAALAPRAAAVRAGADPRRGQRGDGGGGPVARRPAPAPRRHADRRRGVRPLGDRRRAKDFLGMTTQGIRWFWYASPQTFFPLAGKIARVCAVLAVIFALAGLYVGFLVAPTDAQQGEAYRIIYIHVPAAWMSMFIYVVMAVWAAAGLALNTRLSFMMVRALAPTGALFTFIALWTGAFWGRPTWGTYWVWDARLTSELVLLFLYVGFIALANAFEDPRRGDRAAALLALIGLVNLPIIYFSVLWWNTLHQGSTVSLKGTSMHVSMLTGMLLMTFAFWMYAIGAALARVRAIILERESRTQWVRALA